MSRIIHISSKTLEGVVAEKKFDALGKGGRIWRCAKNEAVALEQMAQPREGRLRRDIEMLEHFGKHDEVETLIDLWNGVHWNRVEITDNMSGIVFSGWGVPPAGVSVVLRHV
ncbi:MAG TPA: hypothetical protein VK629_02215 [Steroidobacteraceae bacterium]|nr:hypothetical protein [Steroidobacteraceae bacterium]